jgi:hypothetical protein
LLKQPDKQKLANFLFADHPETIAQNNGQFAPLRLSLSFFEPSARGTHGTYSISGYSGWLLGTDACASLRYTSKKVLKDENDSSQMKQ